MPKKETASDRDLKQIERAIAARHPCVSIVTSEEEHARRLITVAAAGTGDALWSWSAVGGVRTGFIENSNGVAKTEDPAAALKHFATTIQGSAACVMLDLADHLDDAKVLRALRELIKRFRRNECVLFLINHAENLPAIIAGEAVAIGISPPDEIELDRIIQTTVQREHRRKKVHVSIRKSELQTIIRNLRGLTRTQAAQIIRETIVEDRRFHAEDINTVLAHKRQRLGRGGILEYVEAPVDLTSIGGLGNLKRWLAQRENALTDEAVGAGAILRRLTSMRSRRPAKGTAGRRSSRPSSPPCTKRSPTRSR